MRGTVGDILAAPGGREMMQSLFAECSAVAAAAGHALRPGATEAITTFLGKEGSLLTASMLRDVERNNPAEGEHILGDMLARAERLGVPTPILRLARCHLGTYEARRAREQAAR
jgi:2-dehydropantoate 2-reductase